MTNPVRGRRAETCDDNTAGVGTEEPGAGQGKTYLSELTSSLENRKLCSAGPACDFSIFSSISSCEET